MHCQSQLVRKSLLSHVLTPPGWNSCRISPSVGSSVQRGKDRAVTKAEGPQLVLLTTSAGEAFPVSPPCSMQRDPESSLGTFLVPAGSPRGAGAAWVGDCSRAEASAPLAVHQELLPCRIPGVLSSHHPHVTHNQKKHRKELYQKRNRKKVHQELTSDA